MEKSTYNDKVYSDLSFVYGPNKKFACKYVWHLMVDSATGYVTDRFYKAKGSFSKPACEHRQEWKNLETRLKSFNEKTLEKTNFLHQEQESLIGNLAQNLNIQLKQPYNITVLLNWAFQHAPIWQGPCSMKFNMDADCQT